MAACCQVVISSVGVLARAHVTLPALAYDWCLAHITSLALYRKGAYTAPALGIADSAWQAEHCSAMDSALAVLQCFHLHGMAASSAFSDKLTAAAAGWPKVQPAHALSCG